MCVVVSPHPRHGTYHSEGIRNYTYSTYLSVLVWLWLGGLYIPGRWELCQASGLFTQTLYGYEGVWPVFTLPDLL